MNTTRYAESGLLVAWASLAALVSSISSTLSISSLAAWLRWLMGRTEMDHSFFFAGVQQIFYHSLDQSQFYVLAVIQGRPGFLPALDFCQHTEL
jgi:hypothetical protein